MVIPASIPLSGASRAFRLPAPTALLLAIALGLPLAAARSIWARGDRTRTSRSRRQSTSPPASVSAQNISDAKDHAAARPGAGEIRPRPRKRWPNSIHALALDPYNAQALMGRGLIYQGENQHQQAIEDFTAANGLTPQRAEPLLARATSYLALDKTKEAAADLDEAVQADPNNASAWTTRGACL